MKSTPFRRTHGLSIIELMVGLAIGLIVVSAALLAWANQLRETRQLTLETRLMQDLRTTTDLITRDLRRAGHWSDAQAGVWQGAGTAVQAQPPSRIEVMAEAVNFSYSSPSSSGQGGDAHDQFGYRLRDGVIEMRLGADGAWQALTDAGTLFVTRLHFSNETRTEPLDKLCGRPCPDSSTCPRQEVNRIALSINVRSARDPFLTRESQSTVRVRNDHLSGACPT